MSSFVMSLADNFDAFLTAQKLTLAFLKPLDRVFVRLQLLPIPGFIAGARCIMSLRKWPINRVLSFMQLLVRSTINSCRLPCVVIMLHADD